MAFCVGAMSLSTVSCGKLEDEINTLKGQVESINLKLQELESKLNTEVANLNAAIAAVDAKVAVVKVEDKDGMVVLTLANGTTLNVGKPDANANNTGLVTTVTKDGKTYWAVVKNDGTVESLNVEVGHPDVKLSFKVDPETKNLLISYDGKTYESTGVVVKDPDSYKHIVSNFEEGEDYVVFTIGDKQYKLPKYENAGSVLLGRTDMFVLPGATKNITLAAEGVTECYVMSKPDGWKASLKDGVLSVSAPSQAVYEFGACETEGQVLVHATTAGGKCVVAPLNVKTGEAVRLDYKNGNVTVFNALTNTISQWGESFTDFAYISIGITPASVYCSYETPADFFKSYDADGVGFQNILSNYDNNLAVWYEAGVTEEYEATLPFEVLASSLGVELDENESYVIWVAPEDENGYQPEYAKSQFTKPYVVFEASNITYNDADINVTAFGADKFYVGVTNKSVADLQGMTLEMVLEYGPYGMGGPWMEFAMGNTDAMGTAISSGTNTMKLSSFVEEYDPIKPNTEYYVWVMPYVEGKATEDYTLAADVVPYTNVCKTADMVYNENLFAAVTMTASSPYAYSYTLTPPAGATTAYKVYSADLYEESSEADILMDLDYAESTIEEVEGDETWGVNPNSTYYIATFTTKDGEKGPLKVYSLTTPDLTRSADIKVTFQSLEENAETAQYTATYKVEGAKYFAGYNVSYNTTSVAGFEKYVYTQKTATFIEVPADGIVKFTFAKNAYKKHVHATAYNKSEDGAITVANTANVVEIATGTVVDTTK